MYPVAAVRGRQATGGAASYISEWLLRDDFTTPESAPIASPRTAEPGPGTLTRSGSASFFLVSGGKLQSTGSPDYNSSMYFDYGSQPPAGVAALFQIVRPGTDLSNVLAGWDVVNYDSNHSSPSVSGNATYNFLGTPYGSTPLGETRNFVYVMGAIQKTVVMQQQSNGDWAILYTNPLLANARYCTYAPNTASNLLSSWRIVQLASPWNSDYGIATNRVASPTSGETSTMEADAIVEFIWTPAAGETLDLMVRRDSDTDCWSVVCAESTAANANTIKLIERNGGNTERDSKAQTFSAGTAYRIVVIIYGTTIKTHVANIGKNSYTSATNNQTSTGVKVSGFTTGSELIVWPRTLSGDAAAALDEVAA